MQNYIATIKLKFCKVCNLWYKNGDDHERDSKHLKNIFGYEPIVKIESAAKDRLITYYMRNGQNYLDYSQFFDYCKPFIVEKLNKKIVECKSLKCNIIVKAIYIKEGLENNERKELAFKTKNEPLYTSSDLESFCDEAFQKITKEENDYKGRGSGWTLANILGCEIRVNKFNPLRGRKHIALPEDIAKKRAVINVQNNDEMCFKYAVYSKFITNSNAHRVTNYLSNPDFETRYNWNVVNYPVTLKSIPKFEKANNISINVFGLEKKLNSKEHYVYPLKVCKNEKADHRDLLLLKDERTTHFAYIKDFERLVCSQITRHHGRIFVCKSCLTHFTVKSAYDRHKLICNTHTPIRVEMPDKSNNELKFINFKHKQQIPFVIYADFEALLLKATICENCSKTTCNSENCVVKYQNKTKNKINTIQVQRHEPMSFAYKVVNTLGLKSDPVIYRGADAGRVFIERLRDEALHIKDIYDNKLPINNLTDEEITKFNCSDKCHICEKTFEEIDIKVRDHDPLTGCFRGAAHNKCNLMYQLPNFVPVVMHNLSHYDAHFICQNLNIDDLDIKVIPNNEERYISLSKKVSAKFEIRFIDSFRFMASSLDSLAGNLTISQFKETQLHFGENLIDLVTKKGIFPYEYIDSWEKLEEKSLPPIEAFYSSLNKSSITQQQYEYALQVWNAFHIKTLGEYSDLYLLTDVLLLTDVFENFRSVCKTHYDLDALWYYTAPGLSWDSCLKLTGITLELLVDYEMLLLIERGIRGGISQCVKRFGEAKNKYITDEDLTVASCSNSTQHTECDSNYLLYCDVNNLYGVALSGSIPYNGFEWLTNDECKVLQTKILETKSTDAIGYILEVDLLYPSSLHDSHSDLPFCPEKKKPPRGKFEKLLTTLESKSHYVIHIQTLKQCIENGLVLEKIHRAIKFNQSRWLEKYITKNTILRAAAKNDFEKEFFKLMNNSTFGKTMENVRRRINMELVCNNTRKLERLLSKPNFKDRTIFANDLVAIHLSKTRVKFNKPIYIGLTVLELSKKVMYDYHYNKFPNIFGAKNMQLHYIDTDSLIYDIKCYDVYEKIKENLQLFDTSNFPKSHPCYSEERKKKLGLMKDECGGIPLKKFLGLRSKLYTLLTSRFNCTKRAKGIKKCVIEKEISFKDFEAALFGNINQFRNMSLIRSLKHIIYTCNLTKLALSSFDDKRVILSDNIHTLPYGHVSLVTDRKRKKNIHDELKSKREKIE